MSAAEIFEKWLKSIKTPYKWTTLSVRGKGNKLPTKHNKQT